MKTAPNILWIMSDQHAAHALGCYGNPDVRTPHLDALAADGVRFDRAYCNNPICGPSRACFITGQYPHTHGITANQMHDYDATRPLTLARHFRDNGYQTAVVGKAHLPQCWIEEGFEYRRLVDLADADPADPCSIPYFAHLVEHGLADDFDLGTLPAGHPGAGMGAFISALPFEHSTERWTGNESLDFLRKRDRNRPFFLSVSFQRPHDPYAPSPEQAGLYDSATLTLPESAAEYFQDRFRGKPAYQQAYVRQAQGQGYPYRPRTPDDLRDQLAAYYALVSVIDAEIGRLLDYLKETGEDENTIIIYHADHGDFAGEHGLMLKNLGTYESIHRIPWILRYPDCPVGEVCGEMVESVDLYPTLCELACLELPAGLDGRSLVPVAEGRESGADQVCSEWDFPAASMATVLAVRTRDHRLVYYPHNPDDGELYDHATDPHECDNLYRDPSRLSLRLDLTERLLNHLADFHRQVDFATQSSLTGPSVRIHKHASTWSKECSPEPTDPKSQSRLAHQS